MFNLSAFKGLYVCISSLVNVWYLNKANVVLHELYRDSGADNSKYIITLFILSRSV